MKSLRVIMRFAVVLVLLGFLVGQALAERPQTREIRDKVMWGDPDYPLTKKRGEDMPWSVIGAWDLGCGVSIFGVTADIPIMPRERSTGNCAAAEHTHRQGGGLCR